MYSFLFLQLYLPISSLLLIVNLVAVPAAFNSSEICELTSNGTQIKDPTGCNKWIKCVNGEPIEYTCGAGLFYNRNTGKCVPETSINCISSNPCSTLTNGSSGFVPDPYSCSKYYYCANDVPSLGECKPNWNYNPITKTCMLDGDCLITMDPDNYCNIVPDGIFIAIRDNCQDYQECWNGELINSTCPETYYFNAFHGVCIDNEIMACQSFSSSTTVMPPVSVTKCKESGQFIADESTCNGYYYCKLTGHNQFALIHGYCTTGYFFDSTINDGECIIRTEVVCQHNRCAGMGFGKIQLSNLFDDDCKGYAICQNGQAIGTGSCPQNEHFDEMSQLCLTKVVDYPACALLSKTTTIQAPVAMTQSPVTTTQAPVATITI